ncbi:MAG: helix-turn-helix transcriptional regulator [Planctomycetes bacterium]|nr:helix-turn-helix transcriptional regulator [Planctomycetota bacterium]
MKTKANDIGPNVAKLRNRRKLTQDQLAAKLQIGGAEITRQVVANIEARRTSVNDQQITKLAKVLKCSFDELFHGSSSAELHRFQGNGNSRPHHHH